MTRKMFAIALAVLMFGAVLSVAQSRSAPADNQPRQIPGPQVGSGGGSFASGPSTLAVTVNKAVQIPGYVLNPGQYEFKFMHSDTVLISTSDGRGVGFFHVMPVSRKVATPNAQVVLDEVAGSSMMKLATMYFPNDRDGYAFLYPHAQRQSTMAGATH